MQTRQNPIPIAEHYGQCYAMPMLGQIGTSLLLVAQKSITFALKLLGKSSFLLVTYFSIGVLFEPFHNHSFKKGLDFPVDKLTIAWRGTLKRCKTHERERKSTKECKEPSFLVLQLS